MINAENAGISMLRWIPTLSDIFLPRKCLVGYVPRLVSSANYCGFEEYASVSMIPRWEQKPNFVPVIQPDSADSKGTEVNSNGKLAEIHHHTG